MKKGMCSVVVLALTTFIFGCSQGSDIPSEADAETALKGWMSETGFDQVMKPISVRKVNGLMLEESGAEAYEFHFKAEMRFQEWLFWDGEGEFLHPVAGLMARYGRSIKSYVPVFPDSTITTVGVLKFRNYEMGWEPVENPLSKFAFPEFSEFKKQAEERYNNPDLSSVEKIRLRSDVLERIEQVAGMFGNKQPVELARQIHTKYETDRWRGFEKVANRNYGWRSSRRKFLSLLSELLEAEVELKADGKVAVLDHNGSPVAFILEQDGWRFVNLDPF